MVRQAVGHRLRPVRDGLVRTEDVLSAFLPWYRREARAGHLLRLDRRGLGAEHVASHEQHTARRNRQHSFDHEGLHVGLEYT